MALPEIKNEREEKNSDRSEVETASVFKTQPRPLPPHPATFFSKQAPSQVPPPTPPQASRQEPSQESVSKFSIKNLKFLIPVLFVLLIGLAGFLFWRSRPSFSPSKIVEVKYWGLWEPSSVMEGIMAEFERLHPNIKVSYEQQSIIDYRQRLQSALASGKGPDIFCFHNTWLPMFINDLDSVPPSVMDAATFEAAFYPTVKQSLRYNSNYYGVPLMVDTLSLFYNKDIFTTNQVAVPKTWDEFRQVASRLTVRDETGRIQIAGASMGMTANVDHWSDILGLMMLQNGVRMDKPYDEIAEQALQFFMVFPKNDRVWDETLPSSTLAFAGGKLAMYFGPSWRIINIRETNPDLIFGVAPVPQLPQSLIEGKQVAWASYWVEGVSTRSVYKQEAWEFVKYIAEQETLERIYQAGSQAHYIGALYPRQDMASLLNDDSLLAPFVEQASYAQSWYLCSRTFDNGINDAIIKYFEDAVNRALRDESSQLTTTVSEGVASVLSKYGVASQ
ncbi:hypothetical protein COT63_01610 [Candidatus Shapirobacteria bacterium CG09_land_8_20_14_0_10_38_17]|uniref:ABC transporter substrate-binding protein n=1 Tax=Candidatus Shapirobacteria bacterium CG09_land_8_20_14_0_10_38_17 TaxID=1974884 RepID=A0A2H0WR44_9BACT|nr:MAG: hypothetical protein COT63_01610 [Candidatus Shapirobacteria bacterium CG09_land_8_20_14_0_10_38_17]